MEYYGLWEDGYFDLLGYVFLGIADDSFFFDMHCLMYLSRYWCGRIYIVVETIGHGYGDGYSLNGSDGG
jgi:hypothetical protein